MQYGVVIDRAADGSFGVVVPDLPGCYSAGDTVENATHNVREAMRLWMTATAEDGGTIPPPRPLEALSRDPSVAAALRDEGALLALVEPEPEAELAA